MSRFDEIADELYGLTPNEFVSRRNELAKEVRTDGDRELATRISGLRRPTQSAWAVNQWVRANPDDCELISELAADLTAAQRRSAVNAIRELSARRKELVDRAARGVVDTAEDLGVSLSESMIREIVQTLRAAIADAETLGLLRHGRLVSAVEYSGFGPAGVFVVPDPPTGTADAEVDAAETDAAETDAAETDAAETDAAEADAETREADEDSDDTATGRSGADATEEDAAARRALEERLARAEDVEQEARSALAEASSAVDEASSEVDELADRARELREQLSRVEDELRFARQRLSTVEKGRSEAKVALREAVAAVNEIRAALAELD
ncbi:hypothetical protein [Gordonia aurantiaca]|uniref:hypothetical protein n=1 Tax=Gordonia sp. B21 TaxID=3151852 RepID=UPI003263A50C